MASSASGRAAVTPVQRFAQVVGALWLASSRTESSAALGLYFGLAGRRTVARTA
jgi:hypothetical protein